MTLATHFPPSYLTFNNMENQELLFDFSNSPHMSSISNFQTNFSDQNLDFLVHVDELDIMESFSFNLDEFEDILAYDITEKEKILPPPSLIFPNDEMELENLLAITHLVKAYGEAIQNDQTELAEVISKCIIEKVSPIGDTMERLLYYLFQPSDKNSIYLKQESAKIFISAFKAYSMLLPYAKFAFLSANKTILEFMSCDEAETLHIVDFNIGEGTQWSSLIEDIKCKGRGIKITSIKWPENSEIIAPWKFEETKTRLIEYARIFGVKLDIKEVELHNLAWEMKKRNKKIGVREKLVFNCMVGLMGRVRNLKDVLEFLETSKEILTHLPKGYGVLAFGDFEFLEVLKSCSTYSTYLDGCVLHYKALLESMECTFPMHLGDARIAIECLFVSPSVSSNVWDKKWEEKNKLCDFWSNIKLKKWEVSKECLFEGKEMVSSPYEALIEGENKNEMVLKWSGVQLVRVSLFGN